MMTTGRSWREANAITDWEFARIGELLCYHGPRDIALMAVRLEGQNALLRSELDAAKSDIAMLIAKETEADP